MREIKQKQELGWNSVVFLLLCLFNAAPLIWYDYFPSTDGPAHLYNARILTDLLCGGRNFGDFFQINPELVPNWTGHLLLMSFLSMGMSAALAEKLLLLIIFISIPWLLYLITRHSGRGSLMLLSLPLLYNLMLGLGFYNFHLGIVFLLWLIYRINLPLSRSPHIAVDVILMAALYFSHILPFLIACLYLMVYALIEIFQKTYGSRRRLIQLALASAPFLLLSLLFLLRRSGPDTATYAGVQSLGSGLYDLPFLEIYQLADLQFYHHSLVFLFVGLLLFGLTFHFRLMKDRWHYFMVLNGLMYLLLVFLYFVWPDGSSNASYITPRLLMLVVLFFLLFTARLQMPRAVVFSAVVLGLGIQFSRLGDISESIAGRQADIEAIRELSESLEEDALILSPGGRLGGLQNHYDAYFGAFDGHLVLRNYEASYRYFPLQWRDPLPVLRWGTVEYHIPEQNHRGEEKVLTHLFLMSHPDSLQIPLNKLEPLAELPASLGMSMYKLANQ